MTMGVGVGKHAESIDFCWTAAIREMPHEIAGGYLTWSVDGTVDSLHAHPAVSRVRLRRKSSPER